MDGRSRHDAAGPDGGDAGAAGVGGRGILSEGARVSRSKRRATGPRTRGWNDQLQPSVQEVVAGIDDFPFYSTFDTGLDANQVNLMASLTSWCVADPSNSTAFLNMFR
jgi:hypothetical protein